MRGAALLLGGGSGTGELQERPWSPRSGCRRRPLSGEATGLLRRPSSTGTAPSWLLGTDGQGLPQGLLTQFLNTQS